MFQLLYMLKVKFLLFFNLLMNIGIYSLIYWGNYCHDPPAQISYDCGHDQVLLSFFVCLIFHRYEKAGKHLKKLVLK